VRISGMNNVDHVQPGLGHRSYMAKSYPRRLIVMAAGSIMHFVMAAFALLLLHGAVGWYAEGEVRPQLPETEWAIGRVVGGSPADVMGLVNGDRIVAVDSISTSTFNDVVTITTARPGDVISATVLRDGSELTLTGAIGETLDPDGSTIGFFGIGKTLVPPPTPDGFGKAVSSAATDFNSVASGSIAGVINLPRYVGTSLVSIADQVFGGEADGPPVADPNPGPVPIPEDRNIIGIVGILRLADNIVAAHGWPNLLFAFAAANIFIGVFNLIPMLPFDGGHIAIATYERLRSTRRRAYRADVWKLLPFAYAAIAFLSILTAVVLWNDVTSDYALGL